MEKKVFTIEREFLGELKKQIEYWLDEIIVKDEEDLTTSYSHDRISIIIEVIDENVPKLLRGDNENNSN